jgi:ATP-dependent Clp protease protease subunit
MAEAPAPQPPQLPEDVYGIFAGNIDQLAIQKIASTLNIATGGGAKRVHLIFQTSGGNIGDGICLFNYLRTIPLELTLYNVGCVASIGVIAFLGATRRKASTYANFMIHRSYANAPIGATSDRLHAVANSLVLDDERTEALLHKHLKISADHWAIHKIADLWLSSTEALEAGLIDEIGEFAPPKGAPIFYVGPNV